MLLLFCAAPSASAQDKEIRPGQVDVLPGDEVAQVLGHSVRTEDAATCPVEGAPLTLHPMLARPQWACMALTNVAEVPGVWRVDFNATAGQGVNLYLTQLGETHRILSAERRRTMGITEGQGPWLASQPFSIAPGETVVLWTELDASVSLRVDPVLYWARLVPEQRFVDRVTQRAFAIASLLSASVLLIFFLAVFARLLGSRPAGVYALYFSVATAHFVSAEAYLAWVFPNLPVVWAMAPTRFLEIAIFLLYYRFIARFVQAALGEHRLVELLNPISWAVFGLFAFSIAVVALSTGLLVLPEELYAQFDRAINVPDWLITLAVWGAFDMPDVTWFAMGAISAAYALWSVIVLLRARADGAWLFALGVSVIVGLYFLPYVQEAIGLDRVQGFMLTRGLVVADGLIFAAALVRQTFGLRVQRDVAVQQELAASQEKLALAEGLLAAKKGRARAEALAERHRARLALTSHDLRQPLTSLRLALEAAEREAPALKAQLASSLDYLKSVLDDALAESRPTAVTATHAPAPSQEAVPLSVILANTERMFGEEARAKGLSFDVSPTDVVVEADPVALIRALSNLVSNAIKYTEIGGVRVSAMAQQGKAQITIADTGPGLTSEEIKHVRRAYQRVGHGSDGEGIGLSSVQEIAASQGWHLDIDSTPGQGSRFTLAGLRQD